MWDGIASVCSLRERRGGVLSSLEIRPYAAGINAYIAEASSAGTLPVEFATFGITPEEWRPTDSINIMQILWLDVAAGGAEELTNAAHLQQLIALNGPGEGATIFADTHWLDDPDAPTIVPADGAVNPPRRGGGLKLGKLAPLSVGRRRTTFNDCSPCTSFRPAHMNDR